MAKSAPYDPNSTAPFRMSRSKIEQFIRCPRCFVLNVKHGIKDISSAPFTLNVAVDGQLKKEFDTHRDSQTVPQIIKDAGLDLVPFKHENMDKWRHNFTGVSTTFGSFEIFGAVDDIWINRAGELVVVDYKATGRQQAVTQLGEGGFYDGYRRQMEIYQWLLRQNGFKVSSTGYWLYATATQKQDAFDGVLVFEQNLVEYQGNTDWIEETLERIKETLDDSELPDSGHDCDVCRYNKERNRIVAAYADQDELPPLCLTCDKPMSKALYGMLADDPGPGYVVMGCIIEPGAPQWICEHCTQDAE